MGQSRTACAPVERSLGFVLQAFRANAEQAVSTPFLAGRSSRAAESDHVHRLWTPQPAPSAVGWLVGRRTPAPAQVTVPHALQSSSPMPG